MKASIYLTFVLLISCMGSKFANNSSKIEPKIEIASEVDQFISKYGRDGGVFLSDEDQLDSIVFIHLPLIKEYLSSKGENPANYIIVKGDEKGIQNNTLNIPLYHVRGFILSYKRAKESENSDRKRIITGNASGRDGTLQIDLRTNKVINFLRWQ